MAEQAQRPAGGGDVFTGGPRCPGEMEAGAAREAERSGARDDGDRSAGRYRACRAGAATAMRPQRRRRAYLTRRLEPADRFRSVSGLLVGKAGVTFEDLRRIFFASRLLAPVTPGTAFATWVGRSPTMCTQEPGHAGNSGRHVAWIELMLPSGEVR